MVDAEGMPYRASCQRCVELTNQLDALKASLQRQVNHGNDQRNALLPKKPTSPITYPWQGEDRLKHRCLACKQLLYHIRDDGVMVSTGYFPAYERTGINPRDFRACAGAKWRLQKRRVGFLWLRSELVYTNDSNCHCETVTESCRMHLHRHCACCDAMWFEHAAPL